MTENTTPVVAPVEPVAAAPKKKICCACPDTKKLRDECILTNGEDKCFEFIEKHKMCLRAEGFDI
ncbi:hypothetical protein PPL_11461 [Heterostelium album PN500]|uniref:Cytochrome c oxidase copper chaperone n=1 Tax=Heterostelium pallidum (strain ATCC 26659 / Pp 5 / PN500) TaxID=670386 RepID=D3BTG7_HETP5|nr:hypothetical protein PPL_11461 [Heterostelium album PN500]EFA75384.1 hypothetical protein PPL_11461 [Heterostelium album PN500]|eukprot:XP_020427518.1 hypothetical protein PPL_11461 [Heterostelium album PN500]